MKKSLLALAVLGAFAGTAAAQVTVYGQLEVGYGTREARAFNTSDQLVETKSTGVQGQILGASRWGIRGSEDVGNGLKAIFNLETEVQLQGNTNMFGSSSSVFGSSSSQSGAPSSATASTGGTFSPRLAFVGLQGGFGTITLGRDNNPIHSVAAASDVDGRNGFSPTSNLYEGTNRPQALTYTSPNFGGFTVRAQVSNQTSETTNFSTSAVTETDARTIALAAAYANGPLTIGAGFQTIDNENQAGPTNERDHWIVGGAYDLKVVKLFANAQQRKIDAPAADAGEKTREYNIGVSAPVGAFTLIAAAGRNDFRDDGEKVTGTDFVVGANYSLSKRTFTYVRAGRYDTFGEERNKGIQVGVRHAF